MVGDVCKQLEVMELRLAGAVVGLDEDFAGSAVRNCSFEACFKAAAAPHDHDSGDGAGGLESVVFFAGCCTDDGLLEVVAVQSSLDQKTN